MRTPLLITILSLAYWGWVLMFPKETPSHFELFVSFVAGVTLAAYPCAKIMKYWRSKQII